MTTSPIETPGPIKSEEKESKMNKKKKDEEEEEKDSPFHHAMIFWAKLFACEITNKAERRKICMLLQFKSTSSKQIYIDRRKSIKRTN